MDINSKIVKQLPLPYLYKEKEYIIAERERYLTADNINEILRKFPVTFVVADVGQKLNWISNNIFDFWKTELKPHLANDIECINLGSFFDNYAYIASEWKGDKQSVIILFEKYH